MGNGAPKSVSLPDYDVDQQPFATGGLRNVFVLYHGRHKQSGHAVTVHALFKWCLPAPWRSHLPALARRCAARMLELRHPHFLRVDHVHETDQVFVCVTEPVAGSLANAMNAGHLPDFVALDQSRIDYGM